MVWCSDFDRLLAKRCMCFSDESWEKCREGVTIKNGALAWQSFLHREKRNSDTFLVVVFSLHPNDTLHPWDMREFHHVPLRGFREHSRHIYLHRCQAGFVMHVTLKKQSSTFRRYTSVHAWHCAAPQPTSCRWPTFSYNLRPTFVCT